LSGVVREHLDKPYEYGANFWSHGSEAFDCSYLTQTIFSQAGLPIPRIAVDQFEAGEEISLDELKPGDLLFLKGTFENQKQEKAHKGIGHVGLYIGKDQVLQASSRLGKVVVSPLKLFAKAKDFVGARRFVTGNFNHIISVEIPWWRNDVQIEEDLFEEAAKIIGYENMPETLPELPPTDTSQHQTLPEHMQLRRLLSALGLQEVCTYSFVSGKDIEKTGEITGHLQIENPLSSEQDYLRSDLLPSHLNTVSNNQHGRISAAFFEISRAYEKQGKKTLEYWTLGITIWGEASLLRLKGVLDMLGQRYRLATTVERAELPNFIPGRTGKISNGNTALALFGQITPTVLRSFRVKTETSHAEVDISKLIESARPIRILAPRPYQLVERDVTVEVENDILWQGLLDALTKQSDVISVQYLDEFADTDKVKTGHKRVSFRLSFDLGPNPNQVEIDKAMTKSQQLLKTSDFKSLTFI
jgi:phenylalanyl-tRNA synthetase beta subunit